MTDHNRVLALDVHPRSIGFAVFEGPNELLDWGIKDFSPGAAAQRIPASKRILALLDQFSPSAVVIGRRETRRLRKNRRMIAKIERQAHTRGIPLRFVSRADLERAFVGFEANKYEVASALAKQFPILASWLPSKRKCWHGEGYRIGMFEAAATGVAYFTRAPSELGRLSSKNSQSKLPS